MRVSLKVAQDRESVLPLRRPPHQSYGAIPHGVRPTDPTLIGVHDHDSAICVTSVSRWVTLLPDQGSRRPKSRLSKIWCPIHCVLGREQSERFRCVEYGFRCSALAGCSPTQRIRERQPNGLGALRRHAAQPVDQSPGGGAVALHEGVFHEVEVGRREGRVERDRPLQRLHHAVERQEREMPEMEVRVPQQVPSLGILGIPGHQALQQRDRIGAPFIEGSTGSEYERLPCREPIGEPQRRGIERAELGRVR